MKRKNGILSILDRASKRVIAVACTIAVASALLIQPASAQAFRTSDRPRLEVRGAVTQMIVDGKPMLMLGGELNNSNASSVEYMKSVWPRLVKMHLNTVVIPVYWELLEPERSRFDVRLVDAMIAAARANHMKIVFLWFGTWKNSMSCYAPEWMKEDTVSFPRARTADGRRQEIVTPFSPAALNADCQAFTALMTHIRTVDAAAHTVLMIQVENEIGMIPEARDHSPAADSAYAGPVPPELMAYLREHADTLQPELLQAWKRA
jgi:beta-galactosidase GanA